MDPLPQESQPRCHESPTFGESRAEDNLGYLYKFTIYVKAK